MADDTPSAAVDGLPPEAVAAARRRLAPAAPPAPDRLTSIPARRGARVVVVAGPGVVAAGATSGLRSLAGITGATVVNTVGAKGLLRWDDPLHGGTAGLQVGDADLCEIASADLVVTTGLDRGDSASLVAALDRRRAADPDGTVDVHPVHLALAAGGWPPADRPGARPPLYDRIAAVVGPLYDEARTPIPAPAAAAALAAGLPAGGLVVAPAGPVGFWVGRTLPTTQAGSVAVTTGDPPGTAAALTVLAARAGRPTVLVVAEGDAEGSEAAERAAAADGLALRVERWRLDAAPDDGDGEPDDRADDGRALPVDTGALDALVAVAGDPDPTVAPSGLHP